MIIEVLINTVNEGLKLKGNKMKYEVTAQITKILDIEAESEKDAIEKALNQLFDYSFLDNIQWFVEEVE